MKFNKSFWFSMALMLVAGALLRVVNFPPQIAIGVFAGAVISNRKLAFLLPILAMFLSDLLFEGMFKLGLSQYGGFYPGQWLNYILIGLMSFIGLIARDKRPLSITFATLSAPAVFFLLSNSAIWAANGQLGGLNRPMSFDGLMMTYADGLPFLKGQMFSTAVASFVLFTCYLLVLPLIAPKKSEEVAIA